MMSHDIEVEMNFSNNTSQEYSSYRLMQSESNSQTVMRSSKIIS